MGITYPGQSGNTAEDEGTLEDDVLALQRARAAAKPDPYGDVRLADGSPLYYSLLENVTAARTVDPSAVIQAKARLQLAIQKDRAAVLSCQGKPANEARAILERITGTTN